MATRLYGVLGWPIAHSASPAMMNRAFAVLGIDAVYLPFGVPPERLQDAVKGLRAIGAGGVNVTIPHKEAVRAWLDDMSDAARLAGAVNTLTFSGDGRIQGHNTDVEGWWRSISPHLPDGSWTLAILGAGGAVRAVLAALVLYARECAMVRIVGRNPERLRALVRDFGDVLSLQTFCWDDRESAIRASEVVVQCTPLGMWPDTGQSPVTDETCFRPGQVVQDIVYRPLDTRFLQLARRAGAHTVDGLRMLVLQGAAAFEQWLGRPAPVAEMDQAARAFLHQSGLN